MPITSITPNTTPGVYTVEKNAFPNSVVAVPTAIPVFVGYTYQAQFQGVSYSMQPVLITCLNDYLAYFGAQDMTQTPPQPLPPSGQYSPMYYLSATAAGTGQVTVNGTAYDLQPDPNTVYYLYNSVRLFYQNGGGNAYVISVGTYGPPSGKPVAVGSPVVNPNVQLAQLEAGIDAIANQPEITMILCPDANLLDAADNGSLLEYALSAAGNLQSCVAVIDVQYGLAPSTSANLQQAAILAWRTSTGMNYLNYGTAYYPFLETTIAQPGDVNYVNCGGATALSGILTNASVAPLSGIFANIKAATGTPQQNDEALLSASQDYVNIQNAVLQDMNVLPPCGAIAGIYTMVDNTQGVWKAPANVSVSAVTGTTLNITDAMQSGLNVDALTGKSINAIRTFPGLGTLVWGARTLMGNSQDWRYVNVRRTLIMIEQSIKLAAQTYMFANNDASTWSTVTSALTNFLTSLWAQGCLQGSSPSSAFTVACGLGTTMTSQDILNGNMNISVGVAITHPAEFITITYQQMMQTS